MGYPEVARQIFCEKSKRSNALIKWTEEAIAQLSEYKVYEILKKKFCAEPCLLLPNFNEKNLCRLAQETLSFGREEDVLSDEVKVTLKYKA